MTFERMIQAVDTCSGIPMRVITGGVGHIPGNSVLEKMRWLHPETQAGYIIMEQVEYPVMSGGNTISVATVLLETGIIPMQEPVTELTLEAPA